MMMPRVLMLCLATTLLLLTGCGPDAAALDGTIAAVVAGDVAATLSAVPTATPYPTAPPPATQTPWPTQPPLASATPYPTQPQPATAPPWPTHTPFPTLAPTGGPSPTPLPPTAVPWTPTPAGPQFGIETVQAAIDLFGGLRLLMRGDCVSYENGTCTGYNQALSCAPFIDHYDGIMSYRSLPNPLTGGSGPEAYALFEEGMAEVEALLLPWRTACGAALGRGESAISLTSDGGNYAEASVYLGRSRVQFDAALALLRD